MNFIPLAAVVAIVVPVAYLTWALVDGGGRATRRRIQLNLGLRKKQDAKGMMPDSLRMAAERIMPKGYAGWLDKKLGGAGRPAAWPLDKVIVAKPLLALTALILCGLIFLGKSPSAPKLILVLGIGAACYFLPDLLLNNTAQKRRAVMKLALPNMLDQMLISVQAGLGFETSMSRAAQNSEGPLADEFIRTLQDIQVGRSRQDAYQALADRVDLQELRSFVRAVIQADQYGIAIAKVLKAQAQELRVKRRQLAEEHAMKIPVKILFPLLFSIMPAMFLVLLGPAIMKIVQTFSGGGL